MTGRDMSEPISLAGLSPAGSYQIRTQAAGGLLGGLCHKGQALTAVPPLTAMFSLLAAPEPWG